ncbi:MAG: hypothetical protein methR_P0860 [Methyloprofundus sp.]|nr:MAG: hypothetical protein methR_P0860 [Methyloprofundus sp.]
MVLFRTWQQFLIFTYEVTMLLLSFDSSIMKIIMRKILITTLPAIMVLLAFDANARYMPYVLKAVQKITPYEYDQNNDTYVTADEVEVELREDAVNLAIKMFREGASKQEVEDVILDMEDSIEQDAEVIVDILDTDGDELVEPEEMRAFR